MSKPNKANKSNYDQAGRLTPDELAREYKKQTEVSSHAKGKERVMAKAPGPPRGGRGGTRSRTEREE
jgi:hypothetical protein